MRLLVPDVLTLDVNYTAVLGIGASETYTLNFITRGKDWGFHRTNTQERAYGAEWGYGLNLGHLYYMGPVSTLSEETLLGPTRTISGGLGIGGNITAGYADWNAPIYEPQLVGYSAGIGVTLGGSSGVGENKVGWLPFVPPTLK